MMTKNKSITMLDEEVVFCQTDRCGSVAMYLVVENRPETVCVAYCEKHADRWARDAGIGLPNRLLTAS
jgi:hypothetical protein